MISILPCRVTPALKALFDPKIPTAIRCFAVLEGGNAGKILTDQPDNPRWGLVWEADDGTLYRGGGYGTKVLAEAVDLLRQDGIVAMGFREDDPSVNLFPPHPQAGAKCLEFDRPISSSDLSPYMDQLPNGFEVHLMNRSLLERSPISDRNIVRYGSLDHFLKRGLAVCITHEDEVVSEAYADMEVMGRRELGIFTQRAYWRRGLATVACAHLIQLCEESGYSTYWDCAKLNLSSIALARKLGFRNERGYQLLAWFSLPE